MNKDTYLSPLRKIRHMFAWEHTKPIVVSLILVFGLIRPFVVEAYRIPSGSMEDTLLIGDKILVCKFIYGIKVPGTDMKVFDFHEPACGDVFVFIPPHDRENHYIKRIVAVAGDRVETRGETLYVNGTAVDDSEYTKHVARGSRFGDANFPPFRQPAYLPDDETFADYTLTASEFRQKFPEGKPFTVPEGMVFAMGDNRDMSSDSRFWGPVAVDDITGQAFMIVFSSRPARLWEPWKWMDTVRFNRIGKLIR